MKPFVIILWGLAVLGVGGLVGQQTGQERIVRIKLQDGTVLEGPLIGENDQEVSITEERAGGTIQQTRTIARKDIASMAELSAEELEQRAMRLAYANLQRYQLSALNSYPTSYYTQVVERAFRPFIRSFPDSPHAAEVSARIDAWMAEYARVVGGETKYQGSWMDAAAAKRLYSQENAERLLRQARSLISLKQYARAVAQLDSLDTPEARSLKVDAYRQWVQALENEQQQVTQQIQTAQDRVNRSQTAVGSGPPRSTLGAVRDVASGQSVQRMGEHGQEVLAYNQAKAELDNATRDLNQAQARLTAVQRELERVRPLASAAGAAPTATGEAAASGAGSGAKPLYVAVSADKEDWSNPSVLQNMWRFAQRYWIAGAVLVVLGGWFLTRKLAR